MTLEDLYCKKINEMGYTKDPIQLDAVKSLQRLHDEISSNKLPKFRLFNRRNKIKGIYFWGSVGRGKTFLVDLFYNYIEIDYKQRIHFNNFMKGVHEALVKFKGRKNPLDHVANEIVKNIRLLCFDEFYVEDIADAMILGDLFKLLFNKGLILVATSNVKPQYLYAGGLQRSSFLPAIDELINNVEIFNLDNNIDYRWRSLSINKRYFYPLEGEKKFMCDYFDFLIREDYQKNCKVKFNKRQFKALRVSKTAVWFDFEELCGHARGVSDYIEICIQFKIVFMSKIPVLDESREDQARRLIALIDELYDKNRLLIASSKVNMFDLYQGELLKFEFQRTLSRLNEMQSNEYFDERIGYK